MRPFTYLLPRPLFPHRVNRLFSSSARFAQESNSLATKKRGSWRDLYSPSLYISTIVTQPCSSCVPSASVQSLTASFPYSGGEVLPSPVSDTCRMMASMHSPQTISPSRVVCLRGIRCNALVGFLLPFDVVGDCPLNLVSDTNDP